MSFVVNELKRQIAMLKDTKEDRDVDNFLDRKVIANLLFSLLSYYGKDLKKSRDILLVMSGILPFDATQRDALQLPPVAVPPKTDLELREHMRNSLVDGTGSSLGILSSSSAVAGAVAGATSTVTTAGAMPSSAGRRGSSGSSLAGSNSATFATTGMGEEFNANIGLADQFLSFLLRESRPKYDDDDDDDDEEEEYYNENGNNDGKIVQSSSNIQQPSSSLHHSSDPGSADPVMSVAEKIINSPRV